MSYGTETPIREDLLERIKPLIEKHKRGLTVIEYDIQLQTFPQGNPARLVNTWCVIIVCLGALVGRDNWLAYTWTYGADPRPPTDHDLDNGVKEACHRLAAMQVQQIQAQKPNAN